jgi:hypothetical protein
MGIPKGTGSKVVLSESPVSPKVHDALSVRYTRNSERVHLAVDHILQGPLPCLGQPYRKAALLLIYKCYIDVGRPL